MDAAIIAAVVGSGMGVLGGLAGTYFSVKNTQGPKERAFMVRCAVLCWTVITLFVVAMWLLPSPYRFLLWIPYSVVLPIAIRRGNQKQVSIREEETQE